MNPKPSLEQINPIVQQLLRSSPIATIVNFTAAWVIIFCLFEGFYYGKTLGALSLGFITLLSRFFLISLLRWRIKRKFLEEIVSQGKTEMQE